LIAIHLQWKSIAPVNLQLSHFQQLVYCIQTSQVACISRKTPAFKSNLPLTCRVTKISRISVVSTN